MTPRPIRVHTERRIFRSTCQTSLVRAAERTSRMAPMFDGHARLRAVERGLVCACPLGERLFTCSRARIPVTWRKHPYTRHRSRAVAARRRPTRPRSRDRRRPAPSRPQLGKLSSAWPALLPGRSGLRNVQLHGEPGQDACPSPVEAVQEALRYPNGLRAWPPRARPLEIAWVPSARRKHRALTGHNRRLRQGHRPHPTPRCRKPGLGE